MYQRKCVEVKPPLGKPQTNIGAWGGQLKLPAIHRQCCLWKCKADWNYVKSHSRNCQEQPIGKAPLAKKHNSFNTWFKVETHSDTLELSDVERSTPGTMGPREWGPVLVSSYRQWLPPARRGLKPPGNLNILSRSVALLVTHVQTQFLWISIDSDHDNIM